MADSSADQHLIETIDPALMIDLERVAPFPVQMGPGWGMWQQPTIHYDYKIQICTCRSQFINYDDGSLLELVVSIPDNKVTAWRYVPGFFK